MITARSVFSQCSLFADVQPCTLEQLAAAAKPRVLAAGEQLFAWSDPADTLSIVATGRFRATLPDGRIVGEIARLEPIGELGLLSGASRSATVHALRPSLIYTLQREDFHRFALAEPSAVMAIFRIILVRMHERESAAKLRMVRQTRNLAIYCPTPTTDTRQLVAQLHRALPAGTCLVDAMHGLAQFAARTPSHDHAATTALTARFTEEEFTAPLLIDAHGSASWTNTALRHADRIILIIDSARPPDPAQLTAQLGLADLHTPIDLVFHTPPGAQARTTLQLTRALHAQNHYYLDPNQPATIARLARQLTGRGIGLALSGGGARGFAHIGLLKAMQALHLPIDTIGGTSMGAYVGALHATGRDLPQIIADIKDTFVHRRLLNDYRIPRLSLIAGRRFLRHVRCLLPDQRIEHLPLPFFCVTTNLTRGCAEIHHHGPLADWLITSMCLPGIAPPIGYNGDLLCDGYLTNNLPGDVMQSLGRGPVIASDVSSEDAIAAPRADDAAPDFEAVYQRLPTGARVNILDVLSRITTITADGGTDSRAARANAYLRFPLEGIASFDWAHCDRIIETGYRHAMEHLPALTAGFTHSEVPPPASATAAHLLPARFSTPPHPVRSDAPRPAAVRNPAAYQSSDKH